MEKRFIDLSSSEGNVYAVLGITHKIIRESKGEAEAEKLKQKLFNGELKSYNHALDYLAEQAKECGTEFIYQNR